MILGTVGNFLDFYVINFVAIVYHVKWKNQLKLCKFSYFNHVSWTNFRNCQKVAQLIYNNPWLSPLIISFEADKCEGIDNKHIIQIHRQISPYEESINNNPWFSPLILSIVTEHCKWTDNKHIMRIISKL